MISLLIGYEAVARLFAPVPIAFGEAIPIAVLGLLVEFGQRLAAERRERMIIIMGITIMITTTMTMITITIIRRRPPGGTTICARRVVHVAADAMVSRSGDRRPGPGGAASAGCGWITAAGLIGAVGDRRLGLLAGARHRGDPARHDGGSRHGGAGAPDHRGGR